MVVSVCAERGVAWDEVDVSEDPALLDRYAEEIPVVLVDATVLAFWRVDALRLRAALSRVG